ncbi:farnesol kinase, chloroplastic [Capsella rubella]|uniref:farnesol kinase, chloroplastic n=1 Tax=Capsella rubella TaxID=81985 RepID=UPI000CD593A7|nr:farnesol kinase, chloroplastic [Capsella rubella]
MFPKNSVVTDSSACGIFGVITFSCLSFWGEIGKRGILDQKLIRKLVHINIGLVFLLCWPLFSSGIQGALFASLVTGLNIIRMLLLGLGVYHDEGTIKSMTRHGDRRRRLGTERLPYNRNKSFAGSIGMATAGFLASVGYMYYFASFGYIEASGGMILRFAVISIASALVESLPISTDIDDNLTVSLTSALVGFLLF